MSERWALLERLVAFPSVAGRPNGEIAGFVQEWLRRRGVTCDAVPGAGGRVNLLATRGPAEGSGVMLAAHMDVVDAGDGWVSDPWSLERHNGRLAARGSADMKGFLACAMTAIADATDLRRPLHLAISTDEEIGCVGVRDLLPAVRALPSLPSACVVGEPTGMRLVTAHKGKLAHRATLHGAARHSSEAPLADNAVEHAAELVLALRDRGRELAASGRHDERFAIPHSTVSVGPIHGGVVLNVIPDRCTVEFEVRNLPGDDPRSRSLATPRWMAIPPRSPGSWMSNPGPRSISAPRPGCMRRSASPRRSAAPARSPTPTGRESRSRSTSSSGARRFWRSWSRGYVRSLGAWHRVPRCLAPSSCIPRPAVNERSSGAVQPPDAHAASSRLDRARHRPFGRCQAR